MPVYPVTLAIEWLMGRIEAQQEAKGIQFAFQDLAIGATALRLGYAVMTLTHATSSASRVSLSCS